MREAQRLNRLWAAGHRAIVYKALTRDDGTLDRQLLRFMLDAHLNAHREIMDRWSSK
jgi:hypothetical protein